MTTIKYQLTCSLCNTKTDELKRNEHLVATNHLHPYKSTKDEIAKNFFEMIFDACPKKSQKI